MFLSFYNIYIYKTDFIFMYIEDYFIYLFLKKHSLGQRLENRIHKK